jgi:acyl dehydratase
MSAGTGPIGRALPPQHYTVEREKIREYALAVGETNPLHLEPDAAHAAGYDDLVAPPMFAAVYAGPAFAEAMFDPEIGIDFAMLVHGAQEFDWGPRVIAGDQITTEILLAAINERAGLKFYVFNSSSRNQRDEEVCRGIWTVIVRPRE